MRWATRFLRRIGTCYGIHYGCACPHWPPPDHPTAIGAIRDDARDEGYWEGWSDGQDVLKCDLMKVLDLIQGHCASEEWQDKCLHRSVEMLAHHDDIPPDGPCLVWSPICRDCGAEVPGSGAGIKAEP